MMKIILTRLQTVSMMHNVLFLLLSICSGVYAMQTKEKMKDRSRLHDLLVEYGTDILSPFKARVESTDSEEIGKDEEYAIEPGETTSEKRGRICGSIKQWLFIQCCSRRKKESTEAFLSQRTNGYNRRHDRGQKMANSVSRAYFDPCHHHVSRQRKQFSQVNYAALLSIDFLEKLFFVQSFFNWFNRETLVQTMMRRAQVKRNEVKNGHIVETEKHTNMHRRRNLNYN